MLWAVWVLPRRFPLFNFFFMLVFLGSLVQSRCGEGAMLQTNSTVVCTQRLSPTGPVPSRGAQTAPAL